MASYIGLNVGGKIYMTSRTTLTSDPGCFFVTMLNGLVPSARDEHGNYMIDRDGEIFRHVLNFMRSGKLLLAEGFRELSLLECEADFYQLGALQASIQQLKDADEIIGLNVGGKIFKTTRETLAHAPGSRLAAILSGEAPLPPRDEQGNYIFDRSSKMFSYVLEFLRCGHLALPWRSSGWDKLLADEAEFFRMPRLLAHIKSLWDILNRDCNKMYVYHDQSRDQYTAYYSITDDQIKRVLPFILDPAYKSCLGFREIRLLAPGYITTISFKLNSVDLSSNPRPGLRHNSLPTNMNELVSYIVRNMSDQTPWVDHSHSHSNERVDEHCVQYKFHFR